MAERNTVGKPYANELKNSGYHIDVDHQKFDSQNSKEIMLKIPNALINEINNELALFNELGYSSSTEFIIDATRRRLEEIKNLKH